MSTNNPIASLMNGQERNELIGSVSYLVVLKADTFPYITSPQELRVVTVGSRTDPDGKIVTQCLLAPPDLRFDAKSETPKGAREWFEERVFLRYFLSHIHKKTPNDQFFSVEPMLDKDELCERMDRNGESDYKNEIISAMWWAWQEAKSNTVPPQYQGAN